MVSILSFYFKNDGHQNKRNDQGTNVSTSINEILLAGVVTKRTAVTDGTF